MSDCDLSTSGKDLLSEDERAARTCLDRSLASGMVIYDRWVMEKLGAAIDRLAPAPKRMKWIECTPGEALDALIRKERVKCRHMDATLEEWSDAHAEASLSPSTWACYRYRREVPA